MNTDTMTRDYKITLRSKNGLPRSVWGVLLMLLCKWFQTDPDIDIQLEDNIPIEPSIIKTCANCGHCDSGVVHWCLIKKEIEFEGLRSCIFDNHKYWMYDGSGER